MRKLPLVPLLTVLLAAGCGLPQSYYLTPPATPTVWAGPTRPYFEVISTTANSEPEFRGFELYYKCYRIGELIQSSFGETSRESDLLSAQFRPVCSQSDPSPSARGVPLIPIDIPDRGKSFTITVDFNSPLEATYKYTGPGTSNSVSVGVLRYVSDGAGACKTFDSIEFLATDIDISRIFAEAQAQSDPEFYIAMYAMSYGKQDLATTIWSSPVYLGYIRIWW
jgi:hypothetical protein